MSPSRSDEERRAAYERRVGSAQVRADEERWAAERAERDAEIAAALADPCFQRLTRKLERLGGEGVVPSEERDCELLLKRGKLRSTEGIELLPLKGSKARAPRLLRGRLRPIVYLKSVLYP